MATTAKRREYQRRWAKEHREHLCAYQKQWRDENPEKARQKFRRWFKSHRDQHNETRRANRVRIVGILRAIKTDRKCLNCGFDDPRALDFHHRDPRSKKWTIGAKNDGGRNVNSILTEVEKCDVLCANCHRILHAEQRSACGI